MAFPKNHKERIEESLLCYCCLLNHHSCTSAFVLPFSLLLLLTEYSLNVFTFKTEMPSLGSSYGKKYLGNREYIVPFAVFSLMCIRRNRLRLKCKDVCIISKIIHCMHRGGLMAFWKALSLSILKFTTHIPLYREGP